MPRFGSDASSLSQSIIGISDEYGNDVVTTSSDFGASPLGVGPRAQALFGIPNAQFNLTPPNAGSALENYSNPLPFWSIENLSDGRITAKSTFDATTGTWGVVLNPTAGSASDSISLTTRSYVLTDDNLALRQKAYLTMSKGTAYAGATQFGVTMSATYYDATDTVIGTAYTIGTALDNTAMTTINGYTIAGSAAVSANASYVDIAIALTCTAAVTSGVTVNLKSCIISTSAPITGSFVVSETFTSSTTWTRPTGVNYLLGAFVAGGGGGGGGGQANGGASTTGTVYSNGGGGGGAGGWGFAQNIYCGSAATLSVTVGAGGAGGIGGTSNNTGGSASGTNGAAGGATTLSGFSVYGTGSLSATGGGGGAGTPAGVGAIFAGGTAGNATLTYVSSIAGTTSATSGSGGNGSDGRTPTVGASSEGQAFTLLPLLAPTLTVGNAGGSGTATSGAVGVGGALGTAIAWQGLNGSGSGGGGANVIATVQSASAGGSAPNTGGTAFAGPSGLGGGGAARYWTVAGTVTVRGGAGGDGSAFGAGGGGGGGAARVANNGTTRTASVGSAIGGAGGSGASGIVVIWYVG